VRLLGARIGGSLDLVGVHIESPAGLALDLVDAVIDGGVFLTSNAGGRRPVIQGRVDLASTRIAGLLLIRDATLTGRRGVAAATTYSVARARPVAISAPRMSVGAEVTLEGS